MTGDGDNGIKRRKMHQRPGGGGGETAARQVEVRLLAGGLSSLDIIET